MTVVSNRIGRSRRRRSIRAWRPTAIATGVPSAWGAMGRPAARTSIRRAEVLEGVVGLIGQHDQARDARARRPALQHDGLHAAPRSAPASTAPAIPPPTITTLIGDRCYSGHDRGVPLYAGMSDGSPPTDEVRLILQRHRRTAVVGLIFPDRPSHRAMVHMATNGYEITPVNPACDEVMGNACDRLARGPPRWGRSRSSTSSAGPRTSPNRR